MNIIQKYGKNVIRGGFTFLDNLATYMLDKKATRGPLFVSWDIITACNVKCSYCHRWKKENQATKPLTKQEKLKMVKELGKAGVWLLSLCGGEPLLDKDLMDVIKTAKQYDVLVNVSTNGFLLPKKAEQLIEAGVDYITVSVDSHIPDKHNNQRGIPLVFEHLLEGLGKIKSLRKGKTPYLSVRAVINSSNIDETEDYILFWKDRVDEILFESITHSPAVLLSVPECMAIKRESLNTFDTTLKKYSMDDAYNKRIRTFFNDKKKLKKEITCFSGYVYLGIDAEGNVWSCCEHIKQFGNMRKTAFSKIINTPSLRAFRKLVKQKKNHCICWHNCSMANVYLSKLLRS